MSAHFLVRRDGALVAVRAGRGARGTPAPRRGAAARCNDFSVGIELEGADEAPFEAAQYGARRWRALEPRVPIAASPGTANRARRKTDPGPRFDWALFSRSPYSGPITVGLGDWPEGEGGPRVVFRPHSRAAARRSFIMGKLLRLKNRATRI